MINETKDRKEEDLPMEPMSERLSALEAVLFAAGYPVPFARLATILGCEESEAREAAKELAERYRRCLGGIQILLYEEECQVCTREEYESYVREALGIKQGGKLSNASLEVLAIVAYHQPVTRAQIEHIRGVDSTYAVSSLLMKKLIEEKGRLDAPGRPALFGTTADFLRCFGLAGLSDLPDASGFLAEEQLSLDMAGEPDGESALGASAPGEAALGETTPEESAKSAV